MKKIIYDAFDRMNGLYTRVEINITLKKVLARRVNMFDPDAQEKIKWEGIYFDPTLEKMIGLVEDIVQIELDWQRDLLTSVFYYSLFCMGDELSYENIDIMLKS